MKIGLVCPYDMFSHHGGVRQLVEHLAEGLRKKGHTVKIITPRPAKFKGNAPEDYILLGKSRRINAGLATSGEVTFELDNIDIEEVLEREKFDVINFHEPWSPMLARQILSKSEAAHVGTFHANFNDSTTGKSFVNVFSPYGHGIGQKMHVLTAVSSASAAVLVNKAGNVENVKNMRYIPNGIDLSLYKAPKKRTELNGKGTKTILYVGRLERRKGVEMLIKAFGELLEEVPNTYLIIAGEGNRREYLEQLVKTLKIPNVEFLGYITDGHKRHLLGNADLFCSPAMFGESFGIVLVEAMAMGTPIVAGNNNGYASVLTAVGRLGLVDSEATMDFANRLAVFLNDERVRRLWRDWAAAEVKQYDYPKIVDQYELSYKAAMALLEVSKSPTKKTQKDTKRFAKISNRLSIRRHA
jgi:phosphatidyl-myo-inositol alpha-mannosyltransferase